MTRPVRPADPRFLMRVGFVTCLFWMAAWNDVLDDLLGGPDAR